MEWDVYYNKKLEKDLEKMRLNVKRSFAQAVIDLEAEGPNPKGWDTKKLKGKKGEIIRLKLDYRHRLIYEVFRDYIRIELIEVSTREGAYK